jgi:hypothetical protein
VRLSLSTSRLASAARSARLRDGGTRIDHSANAKVVTVDLPDEVFLHLEAEALSSGYAKILTLWSTPAEMLSKWQAMPRCRLRCASGINPYIAMTMCVVGHVAICHPPTREHTLKP